MRSLIDGQSALADVITTPRLSSLPCNQSRRVKLQPCDAEIVIKTNDVSAIRNADRCGDSRFGPCCLSTCSGRAEPLVGRCTESQTLATDLSAAEEL